MHPRRRCAGEEVHHCSCRSTRSCLGGAGRDSLPLLDDGAVERESGGAACQEEPRSRRSRAAWGRNLLPVKAKHVREGRRRCRVSTRRRRTAQSTNMLLRFSLSKVGAHISEDDGRTSNETTTFEKPRDESQRSSGALSWLAASMIHPLDPLAVTHACP